MYKILTKKKIAPKTFFMEIEAPKVAKSSKPGHFIMVKANEQAERIPLTFCDVDINKGSVKIIYKAVGASTELLASFNQGDSYLDFVGPLGNESELLSEDIEVLKTKKIMFIAGGIGSAPVHPQIKWLYQNGIKPDAIIGSRSKENFILLQEIKKMTDNCYAVTDDGSYGRKALVTEILEDLILKEKKNYDIVIAIGPILMMKYVSLLTKKYNIKTIVSLNTLMVCGMGMCGACRATINNKTKFTCIDGPEFDGHLVNYDEILNRQSTYRDEEKEKLYQFAHSEIKEQTVKNNKLSLKRVPVREQKPELRKHNFEEVCYGYNEEEAVKEASRCLNCKKPLCVSGCPVSIDIPRFINHVKNRKFEEAAKIIAESSSLPGVCGRVCPQETQCEGKCILGKKGESVAIGKLERFVADWSRENNIELSKKSPLNGKKVAVVGSGPSGLSCAGDLAKMGYDVTIYEDLHEIGGVLVYGIPEFRLPKEKVVKPEIENLKKLGIKIETNIIISKTITVDDLFDKEGFNAIFIASGAGSPKFMEIAGENLNGVFSANEFLTRVNLMKAYKKEYDTPVYVGKKVAVVGGGNVAIDAARTAVRLGSEVFLVYRRSEDELPARAEEVHHAKEEGVNLKLLTNPIEIVNDDKYWVKGLKCVKMELGEPDQSGRRRPVPIKDSEFILDVDSVIISIGTSPNPLITSSTKGLEKNSKGCIVTDGDSGRTSRKGIFAGGDAVTGAATVIMAMSAGRKAAKAIDEYIKSN